MTSNPIVRKLTFTGSTEIGKLLMKQCADTVKKTSMELGGNAPFIVFDDADLDAAVEGAMMSKFRNTGQTCVCANRIYVQDAVYDAFAEKLKAAVGKMKIGDGLKARPSRAAHRHEGGCQGRRAYRRCSRQGAKIAAAASVTRWAAASSNHHPHRCHVADGGGEGRNLRAAGALFRSDGRRGDQMANDTSSSCSYFYARDLGRSGASPSG